MSHNTERPSKRTPGLVIIGCASHGYRLYVIIAQTHQDAFHVKREVLGQFNDFRLVRDAEAAAERLAGLLPWTDPIALRNEITKIQSSSVDFRTLRERIAEALTGRTIDELNAEHAAKIESRRVREEARRLARVS